MFIDRKIRVLSEARNELRPDIFKKTVAAIEGLG